MTSLTIDPKKTALILIDLQMGVVNRPTVPHSGPDVVKIPPAFPRLGQVRSTEDILAALAR